MTSMADLLAVKPGDMLAQNGPRGPMWIALVLSLSKVTTLSPRPARENVYCFSVIMQYMNVDYVSLIEIPVTEYVADRVQIILRAKDDTSRERRSLL